MWDKSFTVNRRDLVKVAIGAAAAFPSLVYAKKG